MKRIWAAFLLSIGSVGLWAQIPGVPTAGPGNSAGVLFASSFGQWQVPQGNLSSFSWSNPSACTVSGAGIILRPVFAVGTPINIVDANPLHNETVTPTAVTIGASGCSITVATTYTHYSFYITSGTGGLQEAINWAAGLPYQIWLTTDWQRIGGTTGMITAAKGNTNVTISDQRTACAVGYAWNGSAYASQGNACTGGGVSALIGTSPIKVNGGLGPVSGSVTLSCDTAGSGTAGCVIPDGNSAHFLNGSGLWSAPAASGLTSINSQTGPAITLQSSGATIAFTTPSSNVINLEAVGVSGGVQYNPTTTRYFYIGDSRLINSTGGPGNIAASAISCDGTTCTVTGANSWSSGDWAYAGWDLDLPCMVASYFQVATASGTVITFPESQSFSCTGSVSGTTGTFVWANWMPVAATGTEPFFSGHGTSTLLLRQADGGGTVADWDTGFATLLQPKLDACLGTAGPCYLTINLGFDDLYASPCSSLSTLQGTVTTAGSFRKLLNEIHQRGAIKIILTTTSNRFQKSITCSGNEIQSLTALNQWLLTLKGPGAGTSGYLDYADAVVDIASAEGQMGNQNFNSDTIHWSARGAFAFADAMNQAMSAQSSFSPGQVPNTGPNIQYGEQMIVQPSAVSTPQMAFTHNGSTTVVDYYLNNNSGFPTWYVSGNLGSSLRWNGSNTMWGLMSNSGGRCFLNGTDPVLSTIDTCEWRDSLGAGWVAIGNSTKQNTSGGLHFTDLLMGTTAPTGVCSVNGDWRFTGDGAVTWCNAGTWTTFGGAGSGTVNSGTANQLAYYASTGTAVSGTNALPNGTTATTQTGGDNSTKVATTAYVDAAVVGGTRQWSCQPGMGDGLNTITSGTYLQTTCKNTTGSTVTITGVQCYADAGSPTMNVSGQTLGALLTGAVTCTSSFAAGTQSANVLLTNGDYLNFTFVAGGTAKQTTWVVTGTY